MVNKKYLVLILILSLISISAISAADDSTETSINKIKDDKIVLDNNNNEEISRSIENNELNLDKHNNGNNLDSKVNNPTITDSNTLNFSQLNEAINGNTNDTIYLTNNYTYNSGTDSAYIKGIQIGRNLTIYGNGITLDGNHLARIFIITNPTTTNITIHDINFINGHSTDYDGAGAIRARAYVYNCNFTNNTSDHNGGATNDIYAYNCIFTENIGEFGGAMNFGQAFNCTFKNNNATRRGGAIYQGLAYDSKFYYNHGKLGGAMYGNIAYNCIFNNNTVSENGGAVAEGTVYNSTFNNNEGVIGGALFNSISYNCNFTANNASFGGGAMYGGNAYNCIFNNNDANDNSYGGAIQRGNATNCKFYNNIGYVGGALFEGTAINCIFSNNNASFGGGAIGYGYALNCTFTKNHAKRGGALYKSNATESIFTNNNANDGQAMYLGSALFCKFIGNNNTNTTIVTPVLSVTNYTSTYKSGEKLVFNLTANNTNYNGINTKIKIYQNNKLIGTYYSLTGDGWTVDLNPGIYTAVLSLTLHPEIASVNGSINVEKATLNFTSLNETINGNNNSTIYLMNDYLFNEESDQDFITGIYINRNLTIYGNNITIDGNHMARIFNATNFTLTVKFYNITFINGNTTRGGAIYGGDAYYCTFIGNHGQWHGGAIADGNAYNCIFQGNSAGTEGGAILAGNAYNCIFNNNSAKWGGAVFYGSLYNCNFTNNYAIGGGAVFRVNLTNCSLTNNRAEDFGGAVCEAINGFNTIFTNNSAPRGGAILLGQLNNCYFYNNSGEEGGALCNCTVYNSIFADNNGLYGGAIYNTTAFNSIFTNNNASNGGAFYGFNITNATNCTFTNNTASEGQAMYGGNSILCIFNGNDCMNTTIVNVYLNVTNYTSTYNSGAKLIFDLIGNDVYYNDYIVTIKIYKDDTLIKTANGLTGSGWIVDLDYSNYTAVLSIDTHPDVSPVNATITVNKMSTKIIASSTTTVYNVKKELVITLKDAQGKIISGLPVTVKLASSKNYKTDKNGQIKIDISTLTPKAYNGKITYQGDKNYIESTKTVKVTVKKANPKITATAKTYKLNVKTKKYQIILKNNKNQVLKSAKVTLKVNGKTFTAKTNSKGKATFSITNLKKVGRYIAVITFPATSYYNKLTKKVKITVKK